MEKNKHKKLGGAGFEPTPSRKDSCLQRLVKIETLQMEVLYYGLNTLILLGRTAKR